MISYARVTMLPPSTSRATATYVSMLSSYVTHIAADKCVTYIKIDATSVAVALEVGGSVRGVTL